jgi:hypothetical protein
MDTLTTLSSQENKYNVRDNLEYEGVAYPYFKVFCLATGEDTYCTNGLKFNTIEDAETYGKELFFRWWGLDKWMVVRIDFKIEYDLPTAIEVKKLVRTIMPYKGVY